MVGAVRACRQQDNLLELSGAVDESALCSEREIAWSPMREHERGGGERDVAGNRWWTGAESTGDASEGLSRRGWILLVAAIAIVGAVLLVVAIRATGLLAGEGGGRAAAS